MLSGGRRSVPSSAARCVRAISSGCARTWRRASAWRSLSGSKSATSSCRSRSRGMAATMMAGGELAARIRAEVDEEASQIYIERKHDAARDVGIVARDYRLSTDTSEEELLDLVASLNADEAIDGVLVQLPLPGHIDEGRVIRAVEPVKDVDGFHPFNVGQLYLGQPTHVSATPLGIIALLEEHGVALEGARAVVVGRSEIVGKPVALLLLARNATVTICHSRTRDL